MWNVVRHCRGSLYLLIISVWVAQSVNIALSGQLTLDVSRARRAGDAAGGGGGGGGAARAHCHLRFPKVQQLNVLLSYMMNQLTKIFVRANEYVKHKNDLRRELEHHRFKVVETSENIFFDEVFTNMTSEFKHFYKSLLKNITKAERHGDPCDHSHKIKHVWKTLLDQSIKSLTDATLLSMVPYLEQRNKQEDLKMKKNVKKFIVRELKRVKQSQLRILCNNFRLCYGRRTESDEVQSISFSFL